LAQLVLECLVVVAKEIAQDMEVAFPLRVVGADLDAGDEPQAGMARSFGECFVQPLGGVVVGDRGDADALGHHQPHQLRGCQAAIRARRVEV
jgi:hypothetical protein